MTTRKIAETVADASIIVPVSCARDANETQTYADREERKGRLLLARQTWTGARFDYE